MIIYPIVIKKYDVSNTAWVINLNETEIENLKNYDLISEDVKFAANSIIRLKILAALYEKSQNVKELAKNTRINYSSIANTLHGLELKGFIYRESNKYHLSNYIILQMDHLQELKDVVNLLNRFFNIIDGHVVDGIPEDSIRELHLLCGADLLESGGVDAYKINNFIETALKDSKEVRCILPFYHVNFNKRFNSLVKKRRFVEIVVSQEILDIYERKSKVKYMSSYVADNNFLLIVTDKIMILGLFKENGYFDQNRLLTSKNEDSLKWANSMFHNFKRENK